MERTTGPLRKYLNLFVSLWIAEILGFSEFSVYTEVVLLKHFHNTLNYASTALTEEVMKFYNLGDKTFETLVRNTMALNSFFAGCLIVYKKL